VRDSQARLNGQEHMPNQIRHFDIQCDDVERARKFYGAVFGWHIEPFGPPNYYLVFPDYPDRTISGDMRQRTEPLSGSGMRGFACTFGVADVKAIIAAVLANGGTVAVPEHRLEGIGNLAYFIDTEDNSFAAMQYDR
jgi:uncharacterized protein